MPIIAPIPRSERRLMQKTVHKTRDKNHARRMIAMLILPAMSPGRSAAHVHPSGDGLTGSHFTGRKVLTRAHQGMCAAGHLDPHRDKKMAAINVALANYCAEHPVFYEDEMDIHLFPKIGADWQSRGQQKRVVTPGQNEKHYLAGALHTGTGRVSYVGSSCKRSALFISLLKHLKTTYRRAKTITLMVDNYIIHKSGETHRWLKANPKFTVGLFAVGQLY